MTSSPFVLSSDLESLGNSDSLSFSSHLSVPRNSEFLAASDMGFSAQAGTRNLDRLFLSPDNGIRSQQAPMFLGSSTVCTILLVLRLLVYIV